MLTRRQFLARQRKGQRRVLLAPKGQKHARQAEQAALLREQLAAERMARAKLAGAA